MRSENIYQSVLIALGLIASLLLAGFFYREIFPEYLIYQNAYVALQEFRSGYTHEAPPPFKKGVKQILLEREDKGAPLIDRCTTCHVALEVEVFSPTRIARDLNGNIQYDAIGVPLKVDNPDYVWKKLDEAMPNSSLNNHNMRKVLAMHPLMGRETRPFEYHPIDEYGCTSCHGGNGRGLVTDRAHGPVFDGQYEEEYRGFVPKFLEEDAQNDPPFAHVFNAKPGARLLFQTTPIYVGSLIQAKCIQCHQPSSQALESVTDATHFVLKRKENEAAAVKRGFDLEKQNVASLLTVKQLLKERGYGETVAFLEQQSQDYTLPKEKQEALASQVKALKALSQENALQEIEEELVQALGTDKMVRFFAKEFNSTDPLGSIDKTLKQVNEVKQGTLFAKIAALQSTEELMKHVHDVSGSFSQAVQDQKVIGALQTDIDLLTKDYQHGQALFLSQGCFACHRIAGFSRGGVGPELTHSGLNYPWYIKESIVWPQADLRSSTMPNMRLDHEELEALVTYLLGQTGKRKTDSETSEKIALQEWEAGKKLPWEQAVTPKEIFDVRYGMTLFAVEGCASCHRLQGYTSNVGFAVEKEKPTLEQLQGERRWFEALFPEEIKGSEIVQVIEKYQEELDQRIVDNVRQGALLEEIEGSYPHSIEALYSPFKFASRAKNHLGDEIKASWKERVERVLKMYIQIYGLGRLICPRPNWSGVMRSDQWLMEHFKNPSSHVPRSIMPVFPFDDTKFYALIYTLDQVAQGLVKRDREIWKLEGFNPEEVYYSHCAQCHGTHRHGNGPVAEWLYPLPKNLTSAEFLRNLTKERAMQSILHGVPGTPMAPWGEVGKDKGIANSLPVFTESEVRQLVDWLFSSLPGGTVISDEKQPPKWKYQPQDVISELKREGYSFGEEIFEVEPNQSIGPEKNDYYIQQKYYTQQNIEAGRQFFLVNCAPCHGTEADGSGLRAEVMTEAKPRMLTNLDWIESRDDLRLLRSIKYGVPGTAMTPWGDLTNSLQRLQLVIFIRSLTEIPKNRRLLSDALYQAFDKEELKLASLQPSVKKEKQIFAALSNSFINLEAPEEMLQIWAALIDQLQNHALRKKLLDQIDQFLKKQNKEEKIAAWHKQRAALISAFAEVDRLQNEEKK